MAKRVWTKKEIEVSFHNYLREMKEIKSADWVDLNFSEIQVLIDWHFKILKHELKKRHPKRKLK